MQAGIGREHHRGRVTPPGLLDRLPAPSLLFPRLGTDHPGPGPEQVSHLLQQTTAHLWADAGTRELVARAGRTYAERRAALVAALHGYGITAYGDSGLGVWVPLDVATVDSGCMHFKPGSHTGPVLEHRHVNDDPDKPARFVAAEPNFFACTGVDRGSGFEQLADAPEFRR